MCDTNPKIHWSAPGKGLTYEDREHTQIVGYLDVDWAGSAIHKRPTCRYCVLIRGKLISWNSKKHNVVTRSRTKVEYRAMALICQLIWFKQLRKQLQFEDTMQMTLICDNQAALYIASNQFSTRTKHIEINCHFVREKIESEDITTRP